MEGQPKSRGVVDGEWWMAGNTGKSGSRVKRWRVQEDGKGMYEDEVASEVMDIGKLSHSKRWSGGMQGTLAGRVVAMSKGGQ